MIELIVSIVLAFGITLYSIPIIINIAEVKHLFDIPDERKVHKTPIPSLGGLGIFAGFIMSILVTIAFTGALASFQYIVAACLIVFFVGVKDDILIITPRKKFLGQLLSASILVFKGGFVLSNMHGLLGMEDLPMPLNYIFSVFTIIVITNAINLIDGVDGLAGSLGTLICLSLGVFFIINGDIGYACLAFSLMGSLVAFLIFNFSPAKIFMGDTGSLLIGMATSVMIIHFVQFAPSAPVLSFQSAPVVAFAVLFIPLFDTLRVFGFRMLQGKSPFTPDRNHIHHILLDRGLNHKVVTLTLVFSNFIIIILGALGSFVNINFLLIGLLILGFSGVGILTMIKSKAQILRSVSESDERNTPSPPVEDVKKVRVMTIKNKSAASDR